MDKNHVLACVRGDMVGTGIIFSLEIIPPQYVSLQLNFRFCRVRRKVGVNFCGTVGRSEKSGGGQVVMLWA